MKKKKLDIIYEDKKIIVVNKPHGLLTVSTTKENIKTLFRQVSDYVKSKNPKLRVFIINRLDRDTSGIVMFAKSESIKYMYQNNWDNLVKKRGYVAVVSGVLDKKVGTIKSYLKETKTLLVYSSDDKKNGKLAITKYAVIKENKKYSMLYIDIKTGRKNQIRVHMKDMNHPIVGDMKYGNIKSNRMYLHCNILTIINPETKKEMEFISKVPESFDLLCGGKQ